VLAAILTIGNELVSGDTENTNASWLARRLESLGVRVAISASVPDEAERIVDFVRREGPLVDHLIVTGGLGGTPDDITREALAEAFGVPQESIPELAEDLRSRFRGNPDYAARWAALPAGALLAFSTKTPGCYRACRVR
jgi:molybdenum cofactor synthesis domain-containing protein